VGGGLSLRIFRHHPVHRRPHHHQPSRRREGGRVSAFLELSGLRKVFPDGTEAVRGIDLACGEGEFLVLLGPSGCGKTTTLRMIAGLETPTAGTIRMSEGDITQRPPQARDIGFVFQFYALYPHLSVFDNVAFPLQSSG
ncbi:uncharacterized protein METZ01_LOCUS242098, partial [marine metagenome]